MTRLLPTLCASLLLGLALRAAEPAAPIRLLVRADDLGNAQSTNEAAIRSFREGIAKSVEIIAPGQWTPEAVRLVAATPGIDVGVHLCLTSEWEGSKWRPLTTAPSLVDEFGYFVPERNQPKDSARHLGVLGFAFDLREVETELRAQIGSLQKQLAAAGAPASALSHFSTHMAVADGTTELRALTERLGEENHAWVLEKGLRRLLDTKFLAAEFPAAAEKLRDPKTREAGIVEILEKLPSGDWLWVTHPALDTPEIRGFNLAGGENVAEMRAADFRCITSEKIKEVIHRRGIQLISYRDLAAKN